MTSFTPPGVFVPGSHPDIAWAAWKDEFLIYHEAAALDYHSVRRQIAIFRHIIGSEGRRLYDQLPHLPLTNPPGTPAATAPPTRTLTSIYAAFDSYYQPYKNVLATRHTFLTQYQLELQPVDAYVLELKTIAQDCDFGPLTDSLICAKLVSGLRDTALRRKILAEGNVTLDRAINICRADATSTRQDLQMQQQQHQLASNATASATASAEPGPTPLDAIRFQRPNARWSAGGARNRRIRSSGGSNRSPIIVENSKSSSSAPSQLSPNATSNGRSGSRPCSRCGTRHVPRRCPAYGARCDNCHGLNHWAKTCKATFALDFDPDDPGADSYYEEEIEYVDSLNTLHIYALTVHANDGSTPQSSPASVWLQTLMLQKMAVAFKIDTGSQVNVLPEHIYAALRPPPALTRSTTNVVSYSGHAIAMLGTFRAPLQLGTTLVDSLFYVTTNASTPILGAITSTELGLVVRAHPSTLMSASLTDAPSLAGLSAPASTKRIIAAHADVFGPIGKLPGLHHTTLDPSVLPSIVPPRKIPYALRPKVEKELHRMEQQGVIVKVTIPTSWVHPMVVVSKPDGSLRICIDPRRLNIAIQREHFQLPTAQEIYAQLQGCTVFTVLDATTAFWQVELDEESSYLCTFATSFGRFRFRRLPYGISSATEIFQCRMDEIFGHIGSVYVAVDDLLIAALNVDHHDTVLGAVLTQARRMGLKFSFKKLQLAVSHITYLGHTIDAQGLHIDTKKVRAITSLLPPTTKTELQRFLGMVNYLAKFIDRHAEKTQPLRDLLKSQTEFQWDSNSQVAFDRLKRCISSAPVLVLFSPTATTTLSVDSSHSGMGAVLLQNGRPVEYASTSLTSTQQGYAQIEKELLAVVFALEHFHYYVYYTTVLVHTDHKPLLSIITKPLHLLSPRLQRLVLRCSRYTLKLTYVPGKELHIADTLSRAPQRHTVVDTADLEGAHAALHALTTMADARVSEMRESTKQDKTLLEIAKYCTHGWPRYVSSVPAEARLFWTRQGEIHLDDGLLYCGERLIVPQALRLTTLNLLHQAHQGIVACIAKAKIHVYWPGLQDDITRLIQSCAICQKHSRANPKQPLTPHPLPSRPWEVVGSDLFHCLGRNVVVLVDYYSKYIETEFLVSTTAAAVIGALRPHFGRYGAPNRLITDNGPPFNSREFKSFLDQWGVAHSTSSPTYPRSNGLSERAVQTVKNLFAKAAESGVDPHVVLLEYRTTPHQGLQSPAEILMGRRLRTMTTTTNQSLVPRYSLTDTDCALQSNQARMKSYADQHTMKLPDIRQGDAVLYENNHRQWLPATIIKKCLEPQSFILRTPQGQCYRRNRIHLRLHRTPPAQLTTPLIAQHQPHNNRPHSGLLSDAFRPPCITTLQPPLQPLLAPAPQPLPASTTVLQSPQRSTTASRSMLPPPFVRPNITRAGRTIRQPLRYTPDGK